MLKIHDLIVILLLATTLVSCSKEKDAVPENTDSVDIQGSTYPVVKIETQLWTAINYSGPGGISYDKSNNDTRFGKLYTQSEILNIELKDGWRLPTREDYEKLLENSGGRWNNREMLELNKTNSLRLMAREEWKLTSGTNESGFNAYPTGIYDVMTNQILNRGMSALFWSREPVVGDWNSRWAMVIWQDSLRQDNTGASIIRGSLNSRCAVRFVCDAYPPVQLAN